MATIQKLISKTTGAVSFVAQVRIKPFKACQKTFVVVTSSKAARAAAVAWGKAEEKRLRLENEKGQNAVPADLSRLTVGKLINTYLAEPEVTRLRTFKDIDRLVTWWLKEHVSTRILDFNVPTIRAARDKLRTAKKTPGTANRYISAMRACWNWGLNTGFIPQDRAWPRKLQLTEPRGRDRYLSAEELARLQKNMENDAVMRAAILLSIGTGMRESEMLRLHWKDVDLERGKVTLLKTKNDTPRAVHVPATAVTALRELRKAKVVSTAHVFLNKRGKPLKMSVLQKRWHAMFKAAELTDFRWHDLRHSTASLLAQNGATLLEIGSVLGHKSPASTMRYAHLVQGKPVTGNTELDTLLSAKPKEEQAK